MSKAEERRLMEIRDNRLAQVLREIEKRPDGERFLSMLARFGERILGTGGQNEAKKGPPTPPSDGNRRP